MSLVDSSDSKGGRACRVGGRKKIFGTRMFIATIRRSVVDGRRACVDIDVGGVASVGGRCHRDERCLMVTVMSDA